MRIVHIASEAVPFAKTGGLADVAGALPCALAALGERVSIIMPFYGKRMETMGFGASPAARGGLEVEIPLGERRLKGKVLKASLDERVEVYFISEPALFDRANLYGTPAGDYPDNAQRFIFFSRAAIEAISALGLSPDIVHVHDWQAALIPAYLASVYSGEPAFKKTRTLLTIHNLGYQGVFPKEIMPLAGFGWDLFTFDRLEFYDRMNFLKGGIAYADAINTVSPSYAKEILTHKQGMGLETALQARSGSLTGILNGVDYEVWDPASDRLLPANYGPRSQKGKRECKEALRLRMKLPIREETPLIGMVGRLASQKGLDIFAAALDQLMERDVQFAVLGTGEARFHDLLLAAARRHKGRIGVNIGFDETMAHLVEAGSDFFLMPSLYEPCGLNQMISLKYGTIPIVRATGGLNDSVEQFDPKRMAGNGFKIREHSPVALVSAVDRALAAYKKPAAMKALIRNAMKCDFSWARSARAYRALYREIRKR